MFSGIRYRLETSRIEKSTLFEERFLTRAVTRRIRLATRQQVCHDATSIDNTGYGPHMLYRESRRLGHTTSYGFLALALIILAQMAFSGWTLQRMYREMSSTLINLSDIQIESLELKSLLGDVRRFEKDILLASTGERRDIDQAEARWVDSLRKAQEQLQKIRKEIDEHRGQVMIDTTAIDQAIGNYVRGVRELLPKLKESNFPSLQEANVQLSDAKGNIYKLAEELNRIVEDAEEHEEQALRRLAEQRTQLFTAMVAIGALSLVLSIALSISITRTCLSISRNLEHQALHDTLTGLLNRRGLAAAMNADHVRGGSLAYIDLDRFKLVNDLCGHTAGDDLLVELTEKIGRACAQSKARIARVGGDEFAVWLGGEKNLDTIRALSEEIIELIETHHFAWLGQPMHLGASIGLALSMPGDIKREVIARADAACRLAKEPGSTKILVYEDADPALVKARQEEQWAARLPQLIREGRFQLYGQRVISLQPDNEHGHIEILLRGVDDNGQIVSPGTFLSAAERFGLMPKLDRWVIETLLASPLQPDCEYAVNLSGQTLMDKDYLPKLEALLRNSGRARQISFEITESAAMSSVDTAREYIRRLKALGCRFALDDFGSGFSSFAYLRDLQVDFLKIDGSLVRIVGRDDADAALVQAIVQMAQTLGLKTIAEFVETPALASQLAAMGLDYGQGYGLHRPEPLTLLLQPTLQQGSDPSI